MPADVERNMSDITHSFEQAHSILKFQVKHYQKTLDGAYRTIQNLQKEICQLKSSQGNVNDENSQPFFLNTAVESQQPHEYDVNLLESSHPESAGIKVSVPSVLPATLTRPTSASLWSKNSPSAQPLQIVPPTGKLNQGIITSMDSLQGDKRNRDGIIMSREHNSNSRPATTSSILQPSQLMRPQSSSTLDGRAVTPSALYRGGSPTGSSPKHYQNAGSEQRLRSSYPYANTRPATTAGVSPLSGSRGATTTREELMNQQKELYKHGEEHKRKQVVSRT